MRKFLSFVVAMLVSSASIVNGEIVHPDGLLPGDQYRIMFVTRGTEQAIETDLAFYDSFVQREAELGTETARLQGADWQVVASSEADNANNHTQTLPVFGGTPIFLVDGVTLIASDYTDLWDGSLNAAINLDQSGQLLEADVFTGSSQGGARRMSRFLGSGGLTTIGNSGEPGPFWASIGQIDASSASHFYAISGIQTVAVPEPSAFILFATLTGLANYRRRRVPKSQVREKKSPSAI